LHEQVWLIAAVWCACLDRVIRLVRAVLDGLRLALARETLAPAPAESAEPPRRSPGILHILFVSREPLATAPEEPPRAHRSVLRAMFAPEILPMDPELPPAPRRRGRLAALLAFEKLDDDSP
jgi:hypothetical protein